MRWRTIRDVVLVKLTAIAIGTALWFATKDWMPQMFTQFFCGVFNDPKC